MFRWFKKEEPAQGDKRSAPAVTRQEENSKRPSLDYTLHEFKNCADLLQHTFPEIEVTLVYFGHMVGNAELERDVIVPLTHVHHDHIDELLQRTQYVETNSQKKLIEGVLDGKVALFHEKRAFLVDVYGPPARSISESETETIIVGPHDAFVESSGTNLSLIRRRVKSSHLKTIKLSVGEISKTTVYLLYIEDLANKQLVEEIKKRIKNVEFDAIIETHMLIQCIDESPNSIFPQFITTERPDTAASKLFDGKIIGIMDGTPTVFSAPTGFLEFFQSPDDYSQRWILATLTRFLRFGALLITLFFTSLYVAITTYHYEMIPENMLVTLAKSRSRVPFPPIYEALFLEITIELLREAAARLPTKIGQTIGIVGGIVIGQAAVQAGFTSNILIIVVAISALASFVIPNYLMTASIRVARFALILLAAWFGNFGLAVGIAFMIIHLAGLTTLGTPYLLPAAPIYISDWKDTFIRAPYYLITKRSHQSKTDNMIRNKMRE
ncbi:spore germination protein [Aneurinibacillus sp. BA2021]|nr:spore germination protein [Aneurinibacillus sp. BA2021]